MSVSKTRSSSRTFGKYSTNVVAHNMSDHKSQKLLQTSPSVSAKATGDPLKSSSLREEFIRALKVTDKADRTIKTYCDAVHSFQSFINRSPLDVTVNDIRAFFFI